MSPRGFLILKRKHPNLIGCSLRRVSPMKFCFVVSTNVHAVHNAREVWRLWTRKYEPIRGGILQNMAGGAQGGGGGVPHGPRDGTS